MTSSRPLGLLLGVVLAPLMLAAGSARAADLAAAPVAISAAAAPAAGTMDGFVSLAGGLGQVQGIYDGATDGDPANGVTITGAASAVYQSAAMLGFQGDVVLSRIQQTQYSFTGTDVQGDLAGHLFFREPGSFLIGGFGQLGVDNLTSDLAVLNSTFRRGYVGGEAQAYLGDLTLYGQVAAQRLGNDYYSGTGYLANLEARYFLMPNLKVEGHVGVDQITYPGSPQDETYTEYKAGVGAEYRFDATPFSLFAQYDFTRWTEAVNSHYVTNDNRVLVGIKWNFGAETLEDRDHSGASLKPLQFDPLFVVPQS